MGWMYVEQTMATMAGVIGMFNAVSPVKRSWSRAPPGSRGSTSDHRRCARLSPQACGSTAAVGRVAFVDAKKPFYTACDHMLGLTCQRLGSIGQTGSTIHRDGSMASGARPSRRSEPRIGEDGLGKKSS